VNRSRIVLVVCTGLVFFGSGIQSSRAVRFRSEARAVRSAGPSLEAINAELEEARATIARASRRTADARAHRGSFAGLADTLVLEVRLAGAHLARLALEPDGPALTLAATGDRFAVARLVSRVDAILQAHNARAERFSIAGGSDDGTRVDLSIVPGSTPVDPSIDPPAWPVVPVVSVANAIRPNRSPSTPTPGIPIAHDDSSAVDRRRPVGSAVVRWIGTAGADGAERYILRFEEHQVVAVLGEGEAAVFGWSVHGRDHDRLHLIKEGIVHEVHR